MPCCIALAHLDHWNTRIIGDPQLRYFLSHSLGASRKILINLRQHRLHAHRAVAARCPVPARRQMAQSVVLFCPPPPPPDPRLPRKLLAPR